MTHSLALILGGADCVWDDLEAVGRLCDVPSAVVLAVNDVGYAYPGRVDHWCSLHPENFERWEAKRADAMRSMAIHHTIHHRGQLEVYLRLVDAPVPPIYGPTADVTDLF